MVSGFLNKDICILGFCYIGLIELLLRKWFVRLW
jgi:hypothetical protein